MIDWSATGAMTGAFASWAGVAAIVYAAYRAANTLDGFRKEKLLERRLETADNVLTLAYRIKRNMAAVRSPMTQGWELQQAHELLNQNEWYQRLPEQRQAQAQQAQATHTRLKRYDADWDRIFEVMPKARAYFGEEIEDLLQVLCQQVVNVRVSAEAYADDNGADPDFRRRVQQDIWDHGMRDPERNPIGKEINGAIERLEGTLLKVLRDPSL